MELGSTVTLTYRGTLDDGTEFGYAKADNPMVFQTGLELTIPGFEEQVLQMEVGETRTFTVGKYQAYGEYREHFEERIALENIPFHVTPGKRIWMYDDDNGKFPAMVVAVEGGEAIIDMNHPLAGKDLTFEVTLLNVEEPPEGFVSAAEQRRRMEQIVQASSDMGLNA